MAGIDVGAAVVGIILIALYLLPGLIAQHRHHHNQTAIMALNIFLGWTAIGWMAAFIWALTYTEGKPEEDVGEGESESYFSTVDKIGMALGTVVILGWLGIL